MPQADSGRPAQRADAASNRARILASARELLSTTDPADADTIRLNAIARRAGVGQGTLYRHFPTRDDLIAEVYRADVDELVAAARALLSEHSGLDALTRWFDRMLDYARVKRGMMAAVQSGLSRDLTGQSLGRIGEAVQLMLDAGKSDGTIRDDIDARDVILLISYLTRLDESEWSERARRPLDVVIAGLRR